MQDTFIGLLFWALALGEPRGTRLSSCLYSSQSNEGERLKQKEIILSRDAYHDREKCLGRGDSANEEVLKDGAGRTS